MQKIPRRNISEYLTETSGKRTSFFCSSKLILIRHCWNSRSYCWRWKYSNRKIESGLSREFGSWCQVRTQMERSRRWKYEEGRGSHFSSLRAVAQVLLPRDMHMGQITDTSVIYLFLFLGKKRYLLWILKIHSISEFFCIIVIILLSQKIT